MVLALLVLDPDRSAMPQQVGRRQLATGCSVRVVLWRLSGGLTAFTCSRAASPLLGLLSHSRLLATTC